MKQILIEWDPSVDEDPEFDLGSEIAQLLDDADVRVEALTEAQPGHVYHDINTIELATILAALRYWQRTSWNSRAAEVDIADKGGSINPMDDEDIDALCERLNVENE